MSLSELLSRERGRYVDWFASAKARAIAEFPGAAGELLISINTETLAYPYRYLRVDLVSKRADGSDALTEVAFDVDPAFEATGFQFGETILEVYAFTWNAVQFLVDRPLVVLGQIEEWATRWLDIEDAAEDEATGFSGAIHSISPVEHQDGWSFFTCDLGTARIDAVGELIEILITESPSRIVMRSNASQP